MCLDDEYTPAMVGHHFNRQEGSLSHFCIPAVTGDGDDVL